MGNNLEAYRAAIGLFHACKTSLNIGNDSRSDTFHDILITNLRCSFLFASLLILQSLNPKVNVAFILFVLHFFVKYIFMLKPKQLFIIIYNNVCVKRVYSHKTNNNIIFRYGKIPKSQFFVPWSSLNFQNDRERVVGVISLDMFILDTLKWSATAWWVIPAWTIPTTRSRSFWRSRGIDVLLKIQIFRMASPYHCSC
jgi:hypothetical protein